MNFPTPQEFKTIFGEDYWSEFNYYHLDHVRAVVPYDLAPVIQKILEGDLSEEVRQELLMVLKARWQEI